MAEIFEKFNSKSVSGDRLNWSVLNMLHKVIYFRKKMVACEKHPFLRALRRWDVLRETYPAAKSVEKRMFSQAKKIGPSGQKLPNSSSRINYHVKPEVYFVRISQGHPTRI